MPSSWHSAEPITQGRVTGVTAYAQNVLITIGTNTGEQTMQPFSTFTDQNGLRYNLVLDQGGNLWVEQLDFDPGILTLSRSGIQPGSLAVTVQGEGVQYMAFVNPLLPGGSDMPLQWSPEWTDRITQVGPGAAPVFTPSTASDIDYPIASITQPASHSQGSSYFLQSAGPGSNQPGNVVTFYYLDATVAPGPDADLVTAFRIPASRHMSMRRLLERQRHSAGSGSGYRHAGESSTARTAAKTSITSAFGSRRRPTRITQVRGIPAYTAAYQRTLATLTTHNSGSKSGSGEPEKVAVTGVTPSDWNATWTVSQAPKRLQNRSLPALR